MALKSLQGEFSNKINRLNEQIIYLRLYVEAAIDFPEEEIDFLSDGIIEGRLSAVITDLAHLLKRAQQGARLRNGLTLVIAGRPNAGKSSLLNALTQEDTAIVTDIAGTTRDVIREEIHLDGLSLTVLDTAGLRDTEDPVERIGIERAWAAIAKADHALYVIDSRQGWTAEDEELRAKLPTSLPLSLVWNKQDAIAGKVRLEDKEGSSHLYLSAKTGDGIDLLRDHLTQSLGLESMGEDVILARSRHLDALHRARFALDRGQEQLLVFNAGDLLAEELRLAQEALGEITGRFRADELLGRIFSEFCIGK
jgi:tRNA modification GTPase